MKILFDFLPLALFFAAFKYGESHREWAAAFMTGTLGFMVAGGQVGLEEAPVLLSTVVIVLATLVQVLYLKLTKQKVDAILWANLVMAVVLGGLTVYFHNETFIKWKLTGVNWTIAIGFWASAALFKTMPLKAMLKDVELPEFVWSRLNASWVLFFFAMGILNLVVAYNFSTAAWVNYKIFGSTALMLVFFVAQGLYISRHLPEESQDQQP